ncbi:MAG: putative LPS assembly protein LptD [Bacteroidales bacterium]
MTHIRGLTYQAQALVPAVSASFNPSIYGTFQFTRKGSRVESIRHVMKPSVSFSYSPDADFLTSDMFRTVQYDSSENRREYSIYEGSIYGTPSTGRKSGSVAFSLSNIVEAKVYARNDTTGKPKKVKKLIESLSNEHVVQYLFRLPQLVACEHVIPDHPCPEYQCPGKQQFQYIRDE